MGVEDYNSTDKIKEAEKKVTVGSAEFSDNLNNFLNDVTENQNEIISTLKSQESKELKNRLENLLRSQSSEDKNKVNALKFKLATCEPKNIASIIAEYVGYKIGDFDVMLKVDGSNNGISIDSMGQADQKTEQADQKTEQADQKTEQADQKTEQADQDKKVRDQKTEQDDNILNIEQMTLKMEENLELRRNLLVGHDDVKEETEKKAEIIQQQLPEETKNKLKEKGYDDKFINDYILLRVTLNEVKNDSSFDKNAVAQFEKGVNELSKIDIILKNIDNACNVPDTNLNSFSSRNIAQTRTELFNKDSGIGNESLKTARDNNMASHKETYNGMFPEKMGEEDMMKKYGSFLEGELKQFLEDYVNNTGGLKVKIEEIKNNENPTEEEKKILEFYYYMLDELEKKRKETEEQTKNLMEEMCLISQIKGMYMCIGQEEGKDFNLNKAREIESENGIYSISKRFNKSLSFFSSHSFLSNKAL